jgi:hypothetical protein
MKKIMFLGMTVMLFGLCTTGHAQLRKVPAEVTEAFKTKYPNTKNVEWRDKLSVFQVNFEMEGEKYASKFSNKGEWQQTEKEMEQVALPAEVKDGYQKSKFTGWELKSVARVENKDGQIQYRLLVKKSTVEKKYLFFDKEGKLIKDAITI